jgi:hypothetical protein
MPTPQAPRRPAERSRDMLTQQFDAEVFRLDEEGVAALGSLRRDPRFQPLGAVDLPLRVPALLFFPVPVVRAWRRSRASHMRNTPYPSLPTRGNALALNHHPSLSLVSLLATSVSVEGRETQSALWTSGYPTNVCRL